MRLLLVFLIVIMSSGFSLAQDDDYGLPIPSTLDFSWHKDGDLLAVSGTFGVRILNMTSHEEITDLPVQFSPVFSVAFSPDGNRLASAGADGLIEIWDTATWQKIDELIGHQELFNIAWSTDGNQLVGAYFSITDPILRIWDMITYQQTITSYSAQIGEIIWSLDNQQLITATGVGIVIYGSQLVSGDNYRLDVPDNVASVALHPDGNLIAIGTWSGDIYIWDFVLNQQQMVLTGHSDVVSKVAWSSDGSFLVSSSTDKSVKVWDAETGKILQDIVQDERLYVVALSPDDMVIVYGGEYMDGTIENLPTILVEPPNDCDE